MARVGLLSFLIAAGGVARLYSEVFVLPVRPSVGKRYKPIDLANKGGCASVFLRSFEGEPRLESAGHGPEYSAPSCVSRAMNSQARSTILQDEIRSANLLNEKF